MANMRDMFSKLFEYVLLVEQEIQHEQDQRPYEEVRDRIITLLEQAETTAQHQRIPQAEYQDACFAVVAWIDETIAHSTWEHRNRWKARPLQEEYFHVQRAGEELFQRLHKLSPEQKETREIYYYCLGLGFSGQYFLEEDAPKLTRERLEQAQRLPLQVEDMRELTTLTPQPYEVPAPDGSLPKLPWTHLLLKVGFALLVVIPLALWLVFKFLPVTQFHMMVTKAGSGSGMVSSMPTGINCGTNCAEAYPNGTLITLQASPDPGSVFAGWSGDAACAHGQVALTASKTCTATFHVRLTPEMILGPLAGQYPCTKIAVEGIDVQTGVVTLGGRVVSETQRAEIRNRVQGMRGVTQVHDTFELVPWPFCEVVEILEPFKAEGQASGLSARLNKSSSRPLYYKGDNLVVGVGVPAFEGYVYADYYTVDATVSHMFPNPDEPQNFFKPNGSFTTGDVRSPLQWAIGAPFGLELVTVID
jgi:type VI secretion system protein ImpK